jgi:carboxylate-amine ligase
MRIDFHSSAGPSLGVEVELELVDRQSRQLRSAASTILGTLGEGHPSGAHPKVKHELLESTLELITGICKTVPEAKGDLELTLAEVRAHAHPLGVDLLCSGTHPFSEWSRQEISPSPRYHQLVQQMQWPARRLQIFGVHVHVGVRSPEKAIAIANALTTYIPHFLALSASSPYWLGQDTGLASVRSKIFEALPTAGLPHHFADWAEFERFMSTLIGARTIMSIREVWWDIRPHPTFGTVELRICDGLPTMKEVASIAALSQCLVHWLDRRHDGGIPLPSYPGWIVKENKWRAARYGVEAEIIVDESGQLLGLREAVRELVGELLPVAAELGCEEELRYNLTMAQRPSYVRQREVMSAGGSLYRVVESLIEELASDDPAAARSMSGADAVAQPDGGGDGDRTREP